MAVFYSQYIKMEKYQGQAKSDITISGEFQPDCSQYCIFSKYKTGSNLSDLPFRLYASISFEDEDESDALLEKRAMIRGPYKKYSEEEKLAAVEEVSISITKINKGYDVKYVSKKYDIPRRNLLRWRKNGCIRKEGGGRPTDIQMELILCEKIKNFELEDEFDIRLEAKKLSKVEGFKGSKSWFMKFIKRHNLLKKNIEF